MDLNLGYSIMKPIQLPWMYVSPSGLRGLDFHLSPDLFVRLEGIITGDKEFVTGHIVLGIEGVEVDEIQAEHIFMNEYFPNKSKERIARAFKSEQNSCFFTTKQMEHLQKLFETNNFMACNVSVYYKDHKVEDVPSLPPAQFKLVSQAFDNLDVFQKMSHKENKQVLNEKFDANYQAKTAELEDKTKKNLWEKVKHKNLRKRIGMAAGSVAVGITALIAQRKLVERGGAISLIAALIIGTVGVFVELYGRNEVSSTLKQLQFEGKAERMAF